MTVTIDSQPVEIAREPDDTFKSFCKKVMNWLLERNRCIGTCCINGQTVKSDEEGETLFAVADDFVVETVTLQVALQAAIALQCNTMKKLEGDCLNLVTDCLLAEPVQIVASWKSLCTELNQVLGFIPTLAPILTDEQVTILTEQKFEDLATIMRSINESMNKPDVVTVSDILELRLMPWLAALREFFQAQLTVVESLGA
jgi:hypothetical protein